MSLFIHILISFTILAGLVFGFVWLFLICSALVTRNKTEEELAEEYEAQLQAMNQYNEKIRLRKERRQQFFAKFRKE